MLFQQGFQRVAHETLGVDAPATHIVLLKSTSNVKRNNVSSLRLYTGGAA